MLKTNLERTHNLIKLYYDTSRIEVPKYKVGDLVILDSKKLKMYYLTKKFNYKMLGSFKLTKSSSQ
jgi:hypothetical protein